MTKSLILAAAFLLASPLTTLAAEVETQSWRIFIDEDSNSHIQLNIEPLSTQNSNQESENESEGNTQQEENTQTSTNSETNNQDAEETPQLSYGQLGDILINEFVSDPVTGEPEWIELRNTTNQTINLTEWSLTEGGGSITHLEGQIEPNEYLVFDQITGALNNGGDIITLTDPENTKINEIAYGNWANSNAPSTQDPMSVGRLPDNQEIFAEMTPTPGQENEPPLSTGEPLDTENSNNENENNTNEESNSNTPDSTNQNHNDTNTNSDSNNNAPDPCAPEPETQSNSDPNNISDEQTPFVALVNIRNTEIGTTITTEGVVSALPGTLGRQYFYLAGSGVQVYLHSAEFGEMQRGTRVRVTGEVREAYGETRIKLNQTSDIEILSQEDAPPPHELDLSEIGESTEGWLVRLSGLISEKGSNYFLLESPSEDQEVKIYIKPSTGIALSMQVGDEATITGIVSERTGEYRILPRDQEDILIRNSSQEEGTETIAGITNNKSGNATGGWILLSIAMTAILLSAIREIIKKKALAK